MMEAIAAASALVTLATVAACVFVVRELRAQMGRERDHFEAVRSEYARILLVEEQKNRALMDRWYLSKGLPPADVDLKQERDEKRGEAERRRRGAPKGPDDPVVRAHRALDEEEREQMGAS